MESDKKVRKWMNKMLERYAKAEAWVEFDRLHPGVVRASIIECAKDRVERGKGWVLSLVGDERELDQYLPKEEDVHEEKELSDLIRDWIQRQLRKISPTLCSERYLKQIADEKRRYFEQINYRDACNQFWSKHSAYRIHLKVCREMELWMLERKLERSGEFSSEDFFE